MPRKSVHRFIVLRVFDTDDLVLTHVRSLLSEHFYIEVSATFYIQCAASLRQLLANELTRLNIRNCLVYVEKKAGCDFSYLGLSDGDIPKLTEIIKP